MRLEVLADLRRAVFAREPVRARLGVALVGKLFAARKRFGHRSEQLGVVSVRRKLARELGARMLAPHEVPERANLELDRGIVPSLQAARRFLSGKKIVQQRASPTSSPMRSLDGLSHGVAPKKVANRDARGEKSAVHWHASA